MLDLILCTIAIVYLVARSPLFRPLRNFVDGKYFKDRHNPDKRFWIFHHLLGCYFCVGGWAYLLASFAFEGWCTDWRYICLALLKGIVFGGVGGELLEFIHNKKAM